MEQFMKLPGFIIALLSLSIPNAAGACATDDNLEFLVGEWMTGAKTEAPSIVQKYQWGPAQSYIWAQTSILDPNGDEHLHFVGMIVVNRATAVHDYLYVVEPGTGAHEKGRIIRENDGVVVRSVRLVDGAGKESEFRQRFECDKDGALTTSLERRASDGWTPTFPGSIGMIMTKRA